MEQFHRWILFHSMKFIDYFQSIAQSGKFTKYNSPISTCIRYPLQLEILGSFHCKYQANNIGRWMRSLLIVPSIDCNSNVSPSYAFNSFITYIWFSHGISIASKSIYAQVEFVLAYWALSCTSISGKCFKIQFIEIFQLPNVVSANNNAIIQMADELNQWTDKM